ncbi:hypothetical protein CRM22_003859 [Opisthorchis felineus]|uniref:Uncharacterized protein n=1 Tax=Opisthorchis felineus TaxID=147828 RepID=A0A4S2LZT9_OPIFE|nr:hypothetical protein CRM22_003859 [Opisthorchis felineus]
MAFPGANLANGFQAPLGNYFHGSPHFQGQTGAQQPTTYPVFHPAAMAAVAAAAAAAGYSHQLGTRVSQNNGALNLTATTGYPGAYPFGSTEASRATYYSGFGWQQHSAYPGLSATNSLGISKPAFQFPFTSSSVAQFSGATSSSNPAPPFSPPLTSTSVGIESHRSNLSSLVNNRPHSRSSKTQVQKPSHRVRPKKTVNPDETANRKRQEFDELVKARTEKLLSDGPVYTPPGSGPLSSSSSGGGSTCTGNPTGDPSSPNYKKLIEAVLDAKKSELLRSPSVCAYLESRQRALAEFKRRTELFCVDLGK